MEVLTEVSPEGGNARSPETFLKFMESQKELFSLQVDQLQNVVLTQCKLTGVNPLSQEMAAGALSIQIGKRPRDLLNPKAVKYMQSVFAIKDAISKKESREISADFGVKVAQVRDFFASQRTCVRRFVRLSREKDLHFEALSVANGDIPTNTESVAPINPVPLNSLGPSNAEEAPSCSSQSDAMSNLDETEKQFVNNIFNLMAKEETFSGQVKLMNWILTIQSAAVLLWFLTKGGAMIIATWLSQAATEDQTSVLFVILEVLSHLPINEAVPAHVSAILQSVNSLRFYKKSDVSNRAKALLAKWSKMFVRSQALKKPNGMKSSDAAVKERVWKQSLSEIMGEEAAWRSNEEFLAPHEGSDTMRKLESSQPVKLLTAAPDDSNRKSLSSFYAKERRKVQLVEHPNQKSPSRTQASMVVPALANRPITVDDIKKAKLRASYMQSKYRNRAQSVVGDIKIESSMKPSTSDANNLSPVPKAEAQLQVEDQKITVTTPTSIPDKIDTPPKPKIDLTKPNLDECRKNKIQWRAPAEVILDGNWTVGGGEHSKEIEVQRNRNRRDKETLYKTTQEIPPNPKEPWDCEMDYDDSLTPLIPIMQLPDADGAESSDEHTDRTLHSGTTLASSLPVPPNVGSVAAEPDLELLAVLLKNPALVIALTSAQSGNLSNEDKVRLLDLIKTGAACNLNGMVGSVNGREEKVEVSLPSPTPSSEPGMNPFSQQRQVSSSRAVSQAPSANPNDGLHQQLMNLQQLLQLQQTQPAVAPSAHELQMSRTVPDMQQHLSISNPAFTNPPQRPMAVAVSAPDGLCRTQTQQPHHPYTEPTIQKHPYHGSLHSGQSVSGSNTWRDGSGYAQNAYTAVNHHQYTTNLNPAYDGQRWDGNSRVPSRYPEDAHGRGYTDPAVNPGSAYRPERGEQLDPPAYWDPNKQGARWQRNRRY